MSDTTTRSRVLPPSYFLLALVTGVGLHLALPVIRVIRPPFTWLGLIPVLLGILLNLVSDRMFKAAHTTVKPFATSSAMLASGPFRFSRNPMYLGMLLITLGGAILAGTLTPFGVVPLLGLTLHYRFIVHEERMLRDTFGEEYEAYCQRVRRWI